MCTRCVVSVHNGDKRKRRDQYNVADISIWKAGNRQVSGKYMIIWGSQIVG